MCFLVFVSLTLSANALPPTVNLGTSADFGVLGGSTVTNTGATTITRNLGVSPGSAITGFPPGIVSPGTIHAADAVALQAQNDVTTAYNGLAGLACDTDLTGQDLGGLTLTPGVYCFSSSAQLTGTLTLDAQGVSDSVFIFQIGSTLTTATSSAVMLINTASPCNVYWQVGSSATAGTSTEFEGNILALTSITLNTGANVDGRALARNGAVTLDMNDISVSCANSLPNPTNQTNATNETNTTNQTVSTTLTVTKIVINENEGTSVVSDFTLFIDGNEVTSGIANEIAPGSHSVSEAQTSGYNSTISGDCDSDGSISLNLGDAKTCTITNNDIGPNEVPIPEFTPIGAGIALLGAVLIVAMIRRR